MSELNSFVTYIQSLEQRLAALETRIDELQASINELEARPVAVAQVEEEPEVEVELIMEDDTEPEAVAEPAVEPVVEPELIVEPEPAPEPEPEPAPAPEPVVEEPVAEPVIEPESQPELKHEPAPEVEKPHVPVQTSLFGPSVTDIRHAISLGDRFLFQRELFGGKGELMQKTLDTLNQMNSLNEAVSYINSKFKWDMDSTTYELFLNILRRRFS